MKYITELKFLFFIILFLLMSIVSFELLNNQLNDHFYCGTIDPPITPDSFKEIRTHHEVGATLFKENCKSCHKIHEVSVGPALFEITQRRPKKWIYAFVQNSSGLIDKGDTMAVNLYNTYNKNQMTSFPSFTEAEIDSILIYIESLPIYTY